ncbi:hypothetical protein HYPSUDRAFT_49917 [Hypholoma sublateritium FD-334 SS-4]|uniref:Uncharacterized protein n=1 Tax=Hypholoma sublateritium (strain FD-334 SS-4) TaxID=945553 RepID=A0A0D2LR62_HYPSF|nr:hypothetical protein HYPSUDRAFT_49917 [Hypholoma sublateritium FD-334 SS-4]
MASSSHIRGQGATSFSGSLGHNLGEYDPFEGDSDHAVFSGDDGDSDEDNLDDTLSPALEPYYPGVTMCIVCQKRQPYSKNGKNYPTCGMTCARILEDANGSASKSSPRSPQSAQTEDFEEHQEDLCIVCQTRPAYKDGKRSFPTCGNTCARRYKDILAGNDSTRTNPTGLTRTPSNKLTPDKRPNVDGLSRLFSTLSLLEPEHSPTNRPTIKRANMAPCVICTVNPCLENKFVTCGIKCTEKLCSSGSSNPRMCNYCHRRSKAPHSDQCGPECSEKAQTACLLCRSRPKYQQYHLCGKTCKEIAAKWTPLLLEAQVDHATYIFVEKKFKNAWRATGKAPAIKRIYKIIESSDFLQPYDRYKKRVGNEVFRYHGTSRQCALGTSASNRKLCSSKTCALCRIIETSFKTSLANPSGGFGPGIYTSSAANKAYSYTVGGARVMLLTKVILGKVRTVSAFNEVMSCPPGFHSVVFNRQNDTLNETIVYSDDAIRPVFLITF